MKLIYIVTFLLLIIASNIQGQSSKKDLELEQRITIVEGFKENLEKQTFLLQKDFEIKATNLNSDFKTHKTEINETLSTVNLIISIVGLGLLGLFIGSLFYFNQLTKRVAENVANKKITEHLETIVQEKKKELINLISSQNIENQLKTKSHILILTETLKHKEYLQDFFNKVGIKNVFFELSENFKIPPKNIDLIIFDDQGITNNRHNLFREYMDKLSSTEILFIFLGNRFEVKEREKINFANSKFTLYNQIINSLKFRVLTQ